MKKPKCNKHHPNLTPVLKAWTAEIYNSNKNQHTTKPKHSESSSKLHSTNANPSEVLLVTSAHGDTLPLGTCIKMETE